MSLLLSQVPHLLKDTGGDTMPPGCQGTSLRLVMWVAAWSTFPSQALRPSRASWAVNPNCNKL